MSGLKTITILQICKFVCLQNAIITVQEYYFRNMLIELSRLKGMQVGSLEEGSLVGRVEKVIVNPEEIQIIGVLVRTPGFWADYKTLSFLDVVDVDASAVVIRSVESLVESKEIVRLEKLLKYKFEFIGLPVKDKQGKSIGKITDAIIETSGGDILRIYVRSLFNDRVFERSFIEKVTLREVIVRDTEGKRVKADSSAKLAAAKEVAELA